MATVVGMDDVERVLSAMHVYEPESDSAIRAGLRRDALARVGLGRYLDLAAVREADGRPWRQQRLIHLARLAAVGSRLGDRGHLAGESALVFQGCEVADVPRQIHVAAAAGRPMQGCRLPPIRIDRHHLAPALEVRAHRFGAERQVVEHLGIRVADVPTALLDVCRFGSAARALVAVCLAWHGQTGFSRFEQAEGRRREQRLREGLSARIDALGRSARGTHRARAVIAAADAGIESVAEGLMLGILVACRAVSWRTQAPVAVGDTTYFVDFLFPDIGVVVEVDGMGKLGQDPTDMRRNVGRLLRRSGDLQGRALRVIHVRAGELVRPQALVARLRTTAPGLFTDRLGPSPLWLG